MPMRLSLEIPATWQALPGAGHWQVGPGVRAQVLPLTPLPDVWGEAAGPLLRRDLPAGATLRPLEASDGVTALGAPLHVEQVAVLDASGAVIEHRAGVVIHFVDWGGLLLVRAADEAALKAVGPELIAVVASARADFTGHIAALEQLFAWPDSAAK
jgi:hypothetical protein